MGEERDAEQVAIPGELPQVLPRHSAVWIRIGGQWRTGHVMFWFQRNDVWNVWAKVNAPEPTPPVCAFRYDPETIRERTGDTPP